MPRIVLCILPEIYYATIECTFPDKISYYEIMAHWPWATYISGSCSRLTISDDFPAHLSRRRGCDSRCYRRCDDILRSKWHDVSAATFSLPPAFGDTTGIAFTRSTSDDAAECLISKVSQIIYRARLIGQYFRGMQNGSPASTPPLYLMPCIRLFINGFPVSTLYAAISIISLLIR